MPHYDPLCQTSVDGPLTQEFCERIDAIRTTTRMSLADIARQFGISGPFLSKLLRGGSIRSVHLPRIALALKLLETGARIRATSDTGVLSVPTANDLTVDELIRALYSKGFEVTLRLLSRN